MNSTITAKTKVLCVIGDPIEHSISPKMHNAVIHELGLDYVYVAFKIKKESLKEAVQGFKSLGIQGINVTIPHKVDIMQYLDEIDPTAMKIGAINTIKNDNGYLRARNTDGEGALKALIDNGYSPKGKKITIIGAGGASRAIAFFVAQHASEVSIFDINLEACRKLTENLKQFYRIPINANSMDLNDLKKQLDSSDLLINTSPIGMHPKINESPIPKDLLKKHLTVFDIVYNPIQTQLLKDAKELGCNCISGLDMFVNQGAIAFEWWTEKKPNVNLMKEVVKKSLNI